MTEHQSAKHPTFTKAAAASSTAAPKRIWLRPEEQPGVITVKGIKNDYGVVLPYGPREELVANWTVPLQYFLERYERFCQLQRERQRQKQMAKEDSGNAGSLDVAIGMADSQPQFQLENALRGLSIGLFRRGCSDNSSASSIISKSVSEFNYRHDPRNNTIAGSVPFFTPRTPGNVLFRMYYEFDSSYTIAIGPAILVRVLERDFDSSIRFILSNFNKGRSGTGFNNTSHNGGGKGGHANIAGSSPTHNSNSSAAMSISTSLSPLHSLATVLETKLSNLPRRADNSNSNIARSVWGCLQESRKVINACFQEYCKAAKKFNELEEQVEGLKNDLKREFESLDSNNETSNNEDIYVQVSNIIRRTRGMSINDNITGQSNKKSSEGQIVIDQAGDANVSDNDTRTNLAIAISEKTRALMIGRASSERKWRDSQLAFAGIIKAILTNPSMRTLLRRDLVMNLSLEYELWCPISEEFAVPGTTLTEENAHGTSTRNSGHAKPIPDQLWYDTIQNNNSSTSVNSNSAGRQRQHHSNNQGSQEDFHSCSQARSQMQLRNLGFELNTIRLDYVLYPPTPNDDERPCMDRGAVNIFNALSNAMGQYYQELHANESAVIRQREQIRSITQKCVSECGAFPPGTEVIIFGSSANGFGSPKSDIDMCLQLPAGMTMNSVNDKSEDGNDNDDCKGSVAMGKFAEYLAATTNMKEIDTNRLTARIPVVRFLCPTNMDRLTKTDGSSNNDTIDDGCSTNFIECDLSMHNPLAVMNTSFLRSYAEITPLTRVFMAAIKRWAKARDINSPSRHTLSSYGYTIMLLHFLTFHKRTGTGLVTPIAPSEGMGAFTGSTGRNNPQVTQLATPLLPNLQWMDPKWLVSGGNTPYVEFQSLPRQVIKHPLNDNSTVNTYYYSPQSTNELKHLQQLFANQDLSLAILLASFFRYYAYEFDYKRYVVSLHSNGGQGLVERETKAEVDGWRGYSTTLAIEDPFELDYDIAHVLRGGGVHRIRREFALAYTKIVDAATAHQCAWHNSTDNNSSAAKTHNVLTMSGCDLFDWICQPVSLVSSSEIAGGIQE